MVSKPRATMISRSDALGRRDADDIGCGQGALPRDRGIARRQILAVGSRAEQLRGPILVQVRRNSFDWGERAVGHADQAARHGPRILCVVSAKTKQLKAKHETLEFLPRHGFIRLQASLPRRSTIARSVERRLEILRRWPARFRDQDRVFGLGQLSAHESRWVIALVDDKKQGGVTSAEWRRRVCPSVAASARNPRKHEAPAPYSSSPGRTAKRTPCTSKPSTGPLARGVSSRKTHLSFCPNAWIEPNSRLAVAFSFTGGRVTAQRNARRRSRLEPGKARSWLSSRRWPAPWPDRGVRRRVEVEGVEAAHDRHQAARLSLRCRRRLASSPCNISFCVTPGRTAFSSLSMLLLLEKL